MRLRERDAWAGANASCSNVWFPAVVHRFGGCDFPQGSRVVLLVGGRADLKLVRLSINGSGNATGSARATKPVGAASSAATPRNRAVVVDFLVAPTCCKFARLFTKSRHTMAEHDALSIFRSMPTFRRRWRKPRNRAPRWQARLFAPMLLARRTDPSPHAVDDRRARPITLCCAA